MEDLDRELLDLLMLDADVPDVSGARPAPAPVAAQAHEVPVSFAQRRLWFLHRYSPGDDAYHIARAFRLRGVVDPDRIEAVARALTARHAVLRTRFTERDGEPRQIVLPDAPLRMTREDWGDRNAQDLSGRLALEARRPFDLHAAPLMRLLWIQLRDDESVLAVTLHHLISDGASNDIWARDFAAIYEALSMGDARLAALPPLSFQYADLAQREHEASIAGRWDAGLAYWRDYLADEFVPLQLSPATPRGDAPRLGVHDLPLDSALAARLGNYCRTAGCTPFVALLAAWQHVLTRRHRDGDFLIGVPVDGRRHANAANLIGFFVNTQLFRVRTASHESFDERVRAVRAQAIAALDHGNVPYEMALSASQRSGVHVAPFQTLFNVADVTRARALSMGDVQVELITLDNATPQCDLLFNAQLDDGAVTISLEFDRDRIDDALAARLASHFAAWLAAMLESPSVPLAALDVPSPRDAAALNAWQSPRVTTAHETVPLHVAMSAWAARTPHAPALTLDGETLDYATLDARANRLAHRLIAEGVSAEVKVGIALDRSFEMVVAIFAILKAGGAYVPIDPAYPAERQRHIMSDSGIALLLTRRALVHTMPEVAGVRTHLLDEIDLASEPEHAPAVHVHGDQLAYVIYTSGSTGLPKGAQLTHRNVARLFARTDAWFSFRPDDVWTLFHSYAFDFSVWEIFGALCHGGRLVIVPFDISRTPRAFLDVLRRERVTVLNQTPSAFRQLMSAEGVYENPLALRIVIFGGEALEPRTLAPWFAGMGERGPVLVNMYGITETTVHVTYRVITSADIDTEHSPLGRSIDDLGLYVLDETGARSPIGATGELHVSGAGLARGYLDRASLTAQRFIPDPFAAHGGRLYRTGDLARWRDNGELEYLGRIDHQVKVRGFRIELGEIESALLACDGVRESLVIARDGGQGARLMAYVTAHAGMTLAADTLRKSLTARLPDYMVPAAIVVLDAFALTVNGKIDRRALPDAEQVASIFEAPTDGMETTLADVWREVLGVERISRHDDFFALGGDSILTLKLVARAARAGITLTPRQIFEAPVLAAQAAAGHESIEGESGHEIAPLADRGTMPASHAQQRLWFLWNLAPRSDAYHVAGSMHLRGVLDVAALRLAFDGIVKRHEILRTTFRAGDDGTLWQAVHATPDYDFREQSLTAAQGPAWAQEFAAEPFDLMRGPLLRVGVLHLEDGSGTSNALLVAMHHIVADGWSVGVMLDELVAGYRAALADDTPAIEAPAIQYGDYAAWQRRQLDDGERERQLAWWRAELDNDAPTLALPVDRPRRALGEYRAATQSFSLDTALSARLRGIAQSHGATPFVVLLAAFQALLHRHTGQADIRVGVPVANRDRAETSRLIGLFVNMQVMRAQVGARTTVGELVGQVKDRAAGARAHRDLPFDVLVDALQPERSLSHTPLFQVMFNHQREDFRVLEGLPGIEATDYEARERAAQFELTLNVSESPDGLISGSFDYARDLFDEATIGRLSKQYVAVLEAFAASDTQAIGDIDLLDAQARNALLAAGRNGTSFHHTQPVHRMIEAQAARTPHAQALRFDGESMTYAELNTRANQLAHSLIAMGVCPDMPVAIALERSAHMVVGLLAILKAGGAYVPIDPGYPAERVHYMLAHSGATWVITHSSLAGTLPISKSVSVIEIDTIDVAIEAATDPANIDVAGENLAYVIYTSGSTGKPKGVMVRHAALSNFLLSLKDKPGLTENDRWVAVTSLSFDIAALEIYLPLITGATLIIASRATARDGVALADLLTQERATVLQSTPATWRMLIASERPWPVLKALCGGEALPHDLADALRARGLELWNLYGPTETTIWSLLGRVQGKPTLGKSIASTQALLLDNNLSLVPQGVAGELYLAGEGLARGYLHRADLSAERFVPNPYGEPGSRMYRTGDIARLDNAGELHYLGRADHQVKIRGFRIELGEIETQLLAQDGVHEAVVIAHEGTRLIGYYTGDASSETLRVALTKTLPDYMVPGLLVRLDVMPLTPNGKIDRKALPTVDAITREYEAPQEGGETLLADIWKEVLGVERVSRHDNFFELGGDSILVLKLVANAARRDMRVQPRQVFEHQTLALLTTAIAHENATEDRIQRIENRDALPLSPAQQRLWFLWNLQPASAAYHVTGALRLDGALARAALRASFDAIVERHETLRTTFDTDSEGVAHQRIHSSLPYEYRETFAAAEQAHVWAQAFVAAPFELTRGPLLRVGLIALDDTAHSHALVVVLHHIVADGWSIDVLLDEFVAGYRAALAGESAALPPLPVQYADYAVWQRQRLESGEHARQLEYWRTALGPDTPVLALPVDRPRRALGEYRAARHRFVLPASAMPALRMLARRHDATPFVVFLAAFQALLYRHTGQPGIRVGVPVANRDRAETSGLIGMFVNTQVMHAHVAHDTAVEALIAQVRGHVALARQHQDVPFDVLVDALQPERSLSHTPLFQVMFNYQREDYRVLEGLPGLDVSGFATGQQSAQFELTLNINEAENGAVDASFGYASDLFDEATIGRLSKHYEAILEAFAASDAQVIGDIDLLDAQARNALLAAGRNGTNFDHAPPVHRMIEAQAARTPHTQALRFNGESMTYAELNTRANQLAHRLIAMGVCPDMPVAIALERSTHMVVGLLAILKAGGAYVPIDPDYPAERVHYMLAHSGATRVITHSSLASTLPISDSVSVIDIDTIDVANEATTNPANIDVAGENLAYVIYTSGSTGKPKGVMVRHAALSNFLLSLKDKPGLTENDRWVAVTSLSFDIAALEIYLPLITGATLIIASRATARDGVALADLLTQERATVLQSTPATWRMLIASERPWPVLKALCGGEALPHDLADALRARGLELWNLYGPTETTIWSLLGRVQGKPTLGKSIASTQALLLDNNLSLVPQGVAGELYLAGEGLARGYLHRADLSAERFVPNPYGEPGSRMYRTGDIARLDNAGELHYLGRADHQVKIRGFRIELGEIETQLLAQDGVHEAVVIAHEGTRLIGYYTGTASDETLRVALTKTLPDYMVPGMLVRLDTMPLTPNGKIDRKALPTVDAIAREYEAPQEGAETLLADVWKEVLGVERVSRHDNFFELGGHSLLVMQVVSRLSQRHGVSVPLQDFFAAPTLDAMAASFPACIGVDAPIPRRHDTSRAPLTLAQERLWFLWKLDPASAAYNMIGAFKLDGELNVAALRTALDHLVARQEALRARFIEIDGAPWQVTGDNSYGWQSRDLRAAPDSLAQRLRESSRKPFDLAEGPLLRVTLLRTGEREHVLHFATHHIVADEWSIGVIADTVTRAYGAALANVPLDDTPLAITYGDFATWQRDSFDTAREACEIDYWRSRLGNDHPTLELPASRKRAGLRGDKGARVTRALPAPLADALRRVSQTHGATPFMTLFAAFNLLLSRYSGQKDLRVGVPTAGRTRVETEALVGFFVNTLVIRTELVGVTRFSDLVTQVRERLIEAQSHQELPFARLVDALQPARSLGQTPLFQVMFNYTSAPADTAPMPGLQVSPLLAEGDTARFDLVLNVVDGPTPDLVMTYACDIFDEAVVARMLDHYVAMLYVIADPANSSDTALRNIAPEGCNPEPQRATYRFEPVARRISARAAAQPAAPALHCEGERIDYGTLDAWANRIALALTADGVKPDERVGICLRRSVAIVPALLGTLKAGAAFVPLDPEYPADRLAYMIDDASVTRVLTDAHTLCELADLFAECRTFDVAALDHLPARPVDAAVHPDQLAYVIYTSGSTGRPKGVAISHGALSLHLNDFIGTYGISADDRQLQSSTINFDVALHEMLPALIQGGSVEMRGPRPWDLATTSRQLAEERVTFSRIPTAYWQQWLREPPPPASLAALRQITVGGEGLPGDALRQWRAGPLAHIRLDNLYGPTETTVACMAQKTRAGDTEQAIVSIGRPYPSRTAYVCDDEGNELPAGALGELCIGGDTLARGYLDRPALSAEKFIPDPHRSDGARLYRTGDLCRRRADGAIDFLGRMDQQVKLRGLRIELGEIEAALRQVQGVREAVVEVRGEGEERHLVGYTVGEASVQALREGLTGRLPAFMVPSAFVALDVMPLMPNGKLNRAALPAPAFATRAAEASEPADATQAHLLAIWREVLGRDDVGVADNFFELGGDSLDALKVAARITRHGLSGFSIESLFAYPTVAALAERLALGSDMPSNILPLGALDAPRRLFAIHPGYGLVGEYRPLARALEGVALVYGVQSPRHGDDAWQPATMGDFARDYAARIRLVQAHGPYRLVGWSSGGWIAREVAAALEAQGETVDFLGLVDSAAPDSPSDETGALPDIAATDAEIEALLAEMAADETRWRAVVPQGEAGRRLVAAAVSLGKHFDAIKSRAPASTAGRTRAHMHLWLATANPSPEQTAASWRLHADELSVSAIDADHIAIVRHPVFLDSIREQIAMLSHVA
ncbi:amino acid adenylation domain-containing protein [Caballeronia sp. DA-9]|uniref:non-ribosomal peptide synthetase n=1 Tax=Caballeronia sp. DA-9 TaxID=3436237 RepID=UPI003F6635DA